tara:strand:- start:592 stop:735 length:144 start_codon:yes stop_codon:yes gene_type:complete
MNIDKYREYLDCISECCGAPANSDWMICSDCKEHCGIIYEKDLDNEE